jgi:nucleotide-binding universal stress UspA family protein
MFSKLIVGIDGRPGGSDAVALAQTLAADDAEIILVDAFPYDAEPGWDPVHGHEESMRRDALDRLAAEGDDPRFERHAVPDVSPARALHRIAEEEDADLIVVGSCHHGVVGRILLGDVARAVVHDAPCAVAIAPRDYREHASPVRLIGVGVDDSPAALAACDFAGALAADEGAGIRMLTVIRGAIAFTPGYAYAFDWPEFIERSRKAARELQHELGATLRAQDVRVSGDVRDGVPNEELEKLSRDVDLLVVGSRNWGAVKRVVLGSTGDRLAHHAACPVLLVPGPEVRERVAA